MPEGFIYKYRKTGTDKKTGNSKDLAIESLTIKEVWQLKDIIEKYLNKDWLNNKGNPESTNEFSVKEIKDFYKKYQKSKRGKRKQKDEKDTIRKGRKRDEKSKDKK